MKFAITSTEYLDKYLRVFRRSDLGVGRQRGQIRVWSLQTSGCGCAGRKPEPSLSPPGRRGSEHQTTMVRAPCLLLLLLLPVLCVSEIALEPCEVDDDDFRCFCNFTDPQPEWSSAFQCISAVEVEIHGGGRSLEQFLKGADTDPKEYADMVKALRVRRLTVASAQVPAVLVGAFLRALGYSRLKELTLQDLEVTGAAPPPPLDATGPALSTLILRNVSWATGVAWLTELHQWLKPGLKVLHIAQAHPLAFACAQLRTFPALTTLDLSDNPRLGEHGLTAALCPHKFPALRALVLRNAGIETPNGVCLAMAVAGVQPQHLDLSRNSLRVTAPGAPGCVWPSTLNSLNLSFAGLEQVPKGLPARLSVLDLRCNRLNREPRPEELPKVSNLTLDGNPFLDPEAPNYQEDPTKSGVVPACAHSALAVGMSGTFAVLQRVGGFV
ncbi:monocyte differentiation antigen CD14 isoform X2 [Ursus maritimus]|uniref:Monocyte differentiation antigen CD14 n=1 Tax=Ursus maritimus TaxID=29073 RepID=A0A384C5R9_URSMA|nr:monocyte differentiation antigen CD14 isoform X2 [Ursus maritimus]XP_026363935.2 monocyte differentiation antigen CD14 isoform X2 [Ursus arctos]